MALGFRLLRFFNRPQTTLACIRDVTGSCYGIVARGLSSPAASKVEESDRESMDSSVPSAEADKRKPWTPQSRRTGAIAVKIGMTQLWDNVGEPVPVTVLQVLENEVVNVRTKEKEGYWGLQVGGINHPKPKNLLKPVLGQYNRVGITPKRKLWEFRVTKDALLPVGTPILAPHFICGQYVDVCAKSIGKGFQGVMKRHGMKGQPASHGQTKTHRKMGATGGAQDPGRIWPGKRMPGRMGGKRVTTPSLQVVRVNRQFNVIYVRGAVPGHKNTFVRVTDAKRKPHPSPPPFPTYFPELDLEERDGEEFSSVQNPYDNSLYFPSKYTDK